MPFRESAWIRVGLALLLLLACFAPPASAQAEDEKGRWLDVYNLEWQKPWVQWLFAPLFAAVCLLLAFKNPHRSHLD